MRYKERIIIALLLAFAVVASSCSRTSKLGEEDSDDDDAGTPGEYDASTEDSSSRGGSGAYGGTRPIYAGTPAAPPSYIEAGVGGVVIISEGAECDEDGYCYWEDYYCDPWGECCNYDGTECWGTVPVAGTSSFFPTPPPPITGGMGGYIAPPIDPEDYTDDPWDPPIADMGDPGWNDSDDTLCTDIQNYIGSFSIWSDSRGIFAFISAEGSGFDIPFPISSSGPISGPIPFPFPFGECEGEGCPAAAIYHNNGDEWDVYYEEETNAGFWDKQLTGFDNGPLVLYGWDEPFFIGEYEEYQECGLATIEDNKKKCEPVYSVEHVFTVNESLAYGVFNGDIIYYNGNSWGPLPIITPDSYINKIWANETHLFATVDGAGTILMLNEGTWYIHDTKTLQRFSSIWGFSETDVWAGTDNGGLFHYDGDEWKEVSWEGTNCPWSSGILGMWGDDGVLYFYTETQIARIRDMDVEVLNSFSCPEDGMTPRIRSMWGNNPDEVFFAVVDEGFPRRECGIAYMLWFDGKEFHQF